MTCNKEEEEVESRRCSDDDGCSGCCNRDIECESINCTAKCNGEKYVSGLRYDAACGDMACNTARSSQEDVIGSVVA